MNGRVYRNITAETGKRCVNLCGSLPIYADKGVLQNPASIVKGLRVFLGALFVWLTFSPLTPHVHFGPIHTYHNSVERTRTVKDRWTQVVALGKTPFQRENNKL